MLRSSYDVVIVGTDLPALVFGALAAKKGYRVLVLGHGGKDNIYDFEGFHFVRRPHVLFGFADSNPIREVFRELALAPEMRNLPRPMVPTANIVLPDARVEVTHMKGILEEEIQREFPGRLEAFREFVRRIGDVEKTLEPILRDTPTLPPGNIREYLAFRRYRKGLEELLGDDTTDALAPLGDDPRLRTFFAAPLAFMSGLTEPWRHPLPFVRLSNHLLRSLHYVEWGLDALKNLFLDRIRNNSGDVRPTDSVDMLLVRRGRVREVEIRAREETIGCGMLVVGTDLGPVLDLVPVGSAKRRYRARIERIQPSHFLVTVNVGARRAVLPEGMAQTVFVVGDPGKPLEGGNLMVVQSDPAMPPSDALDPERTAIAVCGLLPALRFDGKPATLAAFGRELLSGLKQLLPFLDQHLLATSVSSVGIHPKSGDPIIDPAGLVPIYPDCLPRSLDLATWPVRTAYGNVLHLGDGTSGPLGFEGAFVSAFEAFAILKKKIPLKSGV